MLKYDMSPVCHMLKIIYFFFPPLVGPLAGRAIPNRRGRPRCPVGLGVSSFTSSPSGSPASSSVGTSLLSPTII